MSFLPSRRRRRVLLGAAALTAATIAVAGCATQSPESGGEGADGDFSGQTLNALLITSHEGAGNWLKEHFEEETGAEVNLTIVPYDEIGSTLALDQQSGANTFDVAAPWYVSIGDLAEGCSIQDLSLIHI